MEASVHGTGVHCSDKTFEAAEALLRMDSPSSLREDRSPGNAQYLIIHKTRLVTHLEIGPLETDI